MSASKEVMALARKLALHFAECGPEGFVAEDISMAANDITTFAARAVEAERMAILALFLGGESKLDIMKAIRARGAK